MMHISLSEAPSRIHRMSNTAHLRVSLLARTVSPSVIPEEVKE